MHVDAFLRFSNAQAVTAAADSDSYVDLGAARDAGVGERLYLVSACTVAMTDGSSDSTLDVVLEGDSSTTFTPDYSRTVFTFPAVSAAGTVLIGALGPDDLQYRYAQVSYSPNNGNLSTGSFTTFITHDIQRYKAFADNIIIS